MLSVISEVASNCMSKSSVCTVHGW